MLVPQLAPSEQVGLPLMTLEGQYDRPSERSLSTNRLAVLQDGWPGLVVRPPLDDGRAAEAEEDAEDEAGAASEEEGAAEEEGRAADEEEGAADELGRATTTEDDEEGRTTTTDEKEEGTGDDEAGVPTMFENDGAADEDAGGADEETAATDDDAEDGLMGRHGPARMGPAQRRVDRAMMEDFMMKVGER